MAEESMRATEQRPRLGRGLAALLADTNNGQHDTDRSRSIRKAPIEFLRPNPRNPRKNFDETELEELTSSIRERGVLQPVLVRAISGAADAYEIIAGERRWRAAQRAGQHEIPILLMDVGDREALEIAVIENIQRSDLNALEEAAGYAQLAVEHGYTHADIARIVGKSRSHIVNTLRLTNLPNHSRDLLATGAISAGHARALLAVADPDTLADRIVKQGLTVRDVEKLGENPRKHGSGAVTVVSTNADTRALQEKLGDALGAKVIIRHAGESGEIRIAFRTLEQLDEFCHKLGA